MAAAAEALGFTLFRLPTYSPDLNPIEGLWKWVREEVMLSYCRPTLRAPSKACYDFVEKINLEPNPSLNCLWSKFDLKLEFEELVVSN